MIVGKSREWILFTIIKASEKTRTIVENIELISTMSGKVILNINEGYVLFCLSSINNN